MVDNTNSVIMVIIKLRLLRYKPLFVNLKKLYCLSISVLQRLFIVRVRKKLKMLRIFINIIDLELYS